MSFVQRFDRANNRYLKLDSGGNVIAQAPQPFMAPDGKPIEEIEPVEIERPRVRMSDPLGDMR
ncbi:hypothetical protein FJ422_29650 [Mesorhizobium sp. B2-6-3]|uniref:hypothetical protein n=1 Tax=Mesorhizobium sp. B2-6-3 TaxID=2589914 RepID=UPI001129D7DB|nr:hypothetical protein [Mesorhizobium sp. B2-6-3]TPJ76875.1 hypothetical protein FJ422_29650 [Mesorhizobium sp. B2-6-3]